MDIAAVAAAAAVAETITHPIDFVKTRRQLFGDSIFPLPRPRVVYASLPPAILRHWVYTTSRVRLYETLSDGVRPASPEGSEAPDGEYGVHWKGALEVQGGLAQKFLAGVVAGGTAQFIATPTDVLKVRLQTGKSLPSVRDLYRGWRPNVARAVCVNVGELVAYDVGKTWLSEHVAAPLVVPLASLHSGFWSTLLSTPADVVKTRMMATQATAMQAILEGSLFRGFFLNWCRLGPWQFTFWMTYEHLRFSD